jgi:hypothetical protein
MEELQCLNANAACAPSPITLGVIGSFTPHCYGQNQKIRSVNSTKIQRRYEVQFNNSLISLSLSYFLFISFSILCPPLSPFFTYFISHCISNLKKENLIYQYHQNSEIQSVIQRFFHFPHFRLLFPFSPLSPILPLASSFSILGF